MLAFLRWWRTSRSQEWTRQNQLSSAVLESETQSFSTKLRSAQNSGLGFEFLDEPLFLLQSWAVKTTFDHVLIHNMLLKCHIKYVDYFHLPPRGFVRIFIASRIAEDISPLHWQFDWYSGTSEAMVWRYNVDMNYLEQLHTHILMTIPKRAYRKMALEFFVTVYEPPFSNSDWLPSSVGSFRAVWLVRVRDKNVILSRRELHVSWRLIQYRIIPL